MLEHVNKRSGICWELGLRYDGEYYSLDDINIHHTELLCDTDEEFNTKIELIKKEMERRKNEL